MRPGYDAGYRFGYRLGERLARAVIPPVLAVAWRVRPLRRLWLSRVLSDHEGLCPDCLGYEPHVYYCDRCGAEGRLTTKG